jgi:hypothetical protein
MLPCFHASMLPNERTNMKNRQKKRTAVHAGACCENVEFGLAGWTVRVSTSRHSKTPFRRSCSCEISKSVHMCRLLCDRIAGDVPHRVLICAHVPHRAPIQYAGYPSSSLPYPGPSGCIPVQCSTSRPSHLDCAGAQFDYGSMHSRENEIPPSGLAWVPLHKQSQAHTCVVMVKVPLRRL